MHCAKFGLVYDDQLPNGYQNTQPTNICSLLVGQGVDWLTLGAVIIADVLDGVADDLLVVDVGLGGDLAADHDHPGLGDGLTGDLRKKGTKTYFKVVGWATKNKET